MRRTLFFLTLFFSFNSYAQKPRAGQGKNVRGQDPVRNDAASATYVILGGAAGIEHGFELSNDQLLMMKERRIFLTGTDFSFDNWYAYGMDSATAKAFESMVIDRLKGLTRLER